MAALVTVRGTTSRGRAPRIGETTMAIKDLVPWNEILDGHCRFSDAWRPSAAGRAADGDQRCHTSGGVLLLLDRPHVVAVDGDATRLHRLGHLAHQVDLQ